MKLILIALLFFSMPSFAETLQCDDIPATWEKLEGAVKHSRPNPALTAQFRSLVSSCHSTGHLKGFKKIKYSLGNFDTLVAKGYRKELNREIEARRLGLSGNNQRLNQMASQAGVPSEHLSMVAQLPDGQQQCKPYDYRDKLPPVRDQGSMQWCFGHVAADLASFKLGKNVSPLDAAMLGHEKIIGSIENDPLRALFRVNEADFKAGDMDQGGFTKRALQEMKARGVCLNENLPGNDIQHEFAAQDIRERWSQTAALTTMSMRGRCRSDCELVSGSKMRTLAPNLGQEDIDKILSSPTSNSFTLEVREKACAKRVPFPGSVQTVPHKNVNQMVAAARSQLEKGNIMGFSYDPYVLVSRKWNPKGSGHASVIAGQRWNSSEKRCEFLLRNSWGNSCSSYRPDIECDPNGYAWVPAYDLMSATRELHYVE